MGFFLPKYRISKYLTLIFSIFEDKESALMGGICLLVRADVYTYTHIYIRIYMYMYASVAVCQVLVTAVLCMQNLGIWKLASAWFHNNKYVHSVFLKMVPKIQLLFPAPGSRRIQKYN